MTYNLDHQPPKIFFLNKHRPKGLEFPSCRVCNKQSARHEPVVAFYARALGNHRLEDGSLDKGFDRARRAVERSFPSLIEQTRRDTLVVRNGLLQPALAFDVNHQQVRTSAGIVAAKLGLAMYYLQFHRPAPVTVRIGTMWTHKQNMERAQIVNRLLKSLPHDIYLKQGEDWDTQDTFFIRHFAEGETFWMVAIIHGCISLIAQVTNTATTAHRVVGELVWSPVGGRGIQLV